MPIIGLWLGSMLGGILLLNIYGRWSGLDSYSGICVIRGWIKRRHEAISTKPTEAETIIIPGAITPS